MKMRKAVMLRKETEHRNNGYVQCSTEFSRLTITLLVLFVIGTDTN